MPEPGPGPDFIVAGMMRCGTTSLSAWLRHHPQVFLTGVKEIHYFDRHYDEGPGWYAEHFRQATDAQVAGEATPNYVYDAAALDRIRGDLPDVRLVLLLRDPVERAYSHYLHNAARQRDPWTFEEAVRGERDRLAKGGAEARDTFSYVDRGRYLGQLEQVRARFPEERVQVHLFEDLRDRPRAVFRQVAEFVGVDPELVPDQVGEAVNSYQRFRSVRVRDLARRLPKPAQNAIGRLNRVQAADYPPMAPEVRAHLVREYATERAPLAELLGRDLHEWQG